MFFENMVNKNIEVNVRTTKTLVNSSLTEWKGFKSISLGKVKKISAIVSVNIFESELWMVVKGKIRFSWSHNTLVLLRCHICNASALTVVYSDLLYLDCAPCTNCVTA